MRITNISSFTMFAAALVAACSSTSSNSATASCERIFDAYARATTGCSGKFYTEAARSGFVRSCVNRAIAPGSNTGASFLDACTQALAQPHACNDLDQFEACQVPPGTLPDGQACGDNAQCASGTCQTGSAPSSPSADGGASSPAYCGVCVAGVGEGGDCSRGGGCSAGLSCISLKCAKLTRVADGAACTTVTGGTIGCNAGSYCASQNVNGKTERICVRYPVKGDACTSTCASGLVCLGGKCEDSVAAGGACPTRTECQAGLVCTSLVCTAPTIVQVDQPCGALNAPGAPANIADCAEGLVCVFSASNSIGACRAKVPEGGACSSGRGAAPCEADLVCVGGKCQFKDATLCR